MGYYLGDDEKLDPNELPSTDEELPEDLNDLNDDEDDEDGEEPSVDEPGLEDNQ